jgi:hypothetical protein
MDTCHDVAYNGLLWVAVGYDRNGSGVNIAYSSDGMKWTTINNEYFKGEACGVTWTGKRWVVVGGIQNEANPSIIYSFNGIDWFNSIGSGENAGTVPGAFPPVDDGYSTFLKGSGYGVACNSNVGATIVNSQLALNNYNSVTQTNQLDLLSDSYYNNGYHNITVSLTSSGYPSSIS